MSLLDTPKLGFGLMRLPTMPGEPDRIDIEQTKTMVDMFMEAGLTYFDTAFVYGKDGASEKAAKEALVDRYPRDSFTLATKINAFLMAANEEECKRQFRISLERTGAGYFDFYLLHAIQTNNYKKYDEYGIWDYVKGLKEEGLVKHYGFSFHATPQLLEEILTAHPDVDFVQLQINYADWENPSVTSRANYEVARKHGVPIVVMEPVKGGTLANPPMSVQKIEVKISRARPLQADPELSLALLLVSGHQKGVDLGGQRIAVPGVAVHQRGLGGLLRGAVLAVYKCGVKIGQARLHEHIHHLFGLFNINGVRLAGHDGKAHQAESQFGRIQ